MSNFWLSVKVNMKSPHGSTWVWNQNTPFLSVPWHADGQHTTCKEEEKGLCNMPSIQKKKNEQTTTRGRKEGEGHRKAMSPRCREANSQRAGERGHLCPCRSDYRRAMRPVTQCTEARVISRTDNWTLILVDIVVGNDMSSWQGLCARICWSGRETKGMFGRLDLGPCRHRARDDTAINHELPSWAAFPKKNQWVPAFGGGGHDSQDHIEPRRCLHTSACIKIYGHV